MKTFSPPNLATYICSHVFEKSRPILLVIHEDNDWIFCCGGEDHSEKDWKVVGVGHLISRDSTLHECADLANGFEAERSGVDKDWIRMEIDDCAC